MKRTALYLAATALTATFAASAFAQDYFYEEYAQTYTPRTTALESIDVTANRIGPMTPVAVKGTVAAKEGNVLVINRGGEQIRANLREQHDYASLYAGSTMRKLSLGDNVTLYGTLDKAPGEPTYVKADAVRNLSTGRLMLTDRGDQKIADMRLPVTLRYNVL